jgi:zinc transport system permease protein
MDALTFETIRNALIAGLLAAIAAGVIGVYIVIRRMVSISGSVAHASLSGVGLGLIASFSPLIGALVLTPVAAVGMGVIVKKTRLPEDTAIGILWATGMAIGVVLAALAHNTADLSTYLFGDILSVPDSDLILMGVLDVVIILAVLRFYREFLSISFDEEFARIVGVSTLPLYFFMLFLIALTVVALLRVAGIILVIALLAIPAALSRRLTFSVPKMILLSCLFSAFFTFSGLFISLQFQLPSGAIIAILCGVTFIVFLIISGFRERTKKIKL